MFENNKYVYGQSAAKLLNNDVNHDMKNVQRLSREGVDCKLLTIEVVCGIITRRM